ncbi:hypothetical protein GGR57DRAFT_385050 [Xylariaceae sp. FL1272]|nr:hypothetical protein GGR57DRAFT_385050 [Xylariaceae sp. FL1272]
MRIFKKATFIIRCRRQPAGMGHSGDPVEISSNNENSQTAEKEEQQEEEDIRSLQHDFEKDMRMKLMLDQGKRRLKHLHGRYWNRYPTRLSPAMSYELACLQSMMEDPMKTDYIFLYDQLLDVEVFKAVSNITGPPPIMVSAIISGFKVMKERGVPVLLAANSTQATGAVCRLQCPIQLLNIQLFLSWSLKATMRPVWIYSDEWVSKEITAIVFVWAHRPSKFVLEEGNFDIRAYMASEEKAQDLEWKNHKYHADDTDNFAFTMAEGFSDTKCTHPQPVIEFSRAPTRESSKMENRETEKYGYMQEGPDQ